MTNTIQPSPAAEHLPVIDRNVPAHLETATFALGWFWGPDSRFGGLDGIVRTRVGYTGAEKVNPTYRDLGGHTEAFQVDFDPTVIAYADLLELFWGAHDPSFRVRSSQYKPAIFWHTDEQRRLAEETAAREARNTGRPVVTEILAASAFYRAEDYHQKYYLKRETPWTKALAAIYPEANDFTDSTAAARLNGLAGGHGSLAELRPQLAPLQGI